MKKNSISIVVIIVAFSLSLSYVLFSFVVFPAKKRSAKVESVTGISEDFVLPDAKYFNTDSINPAKPTGIAPNTEQDNLTTGE